MDETKPQDELSQLKRALVALKAMRSRVETMERARTEPIAIIGMSCRYPGGADDPEAFWRLLHDGVDCVSEVPPDRWDIDAYYDPDPDAPGKMNTRWGGFISNVDQFDPHFFGIAPREAVRMDPQHRLLLEVAWEALENAGQAVDKLSGSPTGVFLGISTSDYASRAMQANVPIDAYAGTGGSSSLAVGRLSYLLGLQGPNFAVDTACSSSLVALHSACQSLRLGECRMALVGGVNVILLPEGTVYFSKVRAMSPSGRCKSFDASADGYVRGEGCGVIVLKKLSDAIADRDNILAVIRSSALNHDGRSNGLTAPNGNAQRALIRSALSFAGIQPSEIDYVETHGTGTPLGDPIEIEALAEVLGENRQGDQKLVLGSVKTNIGHLEAAAGLAGLIKLVLALQHEQIPPHLHLKRLNPFINWGNVPIEISTRLTPWPRSERKRRGSLSSFGFSGTNVHVILEEAPRREESAGSMDRPLHLLTLSARTESALKEQALRYARLLETTTESFADVAYTANAGRSHFAYRLAVVAANSAEARERLLAFASGEWVRGLYSGQKQRASQPKMAFLFTGQGSQYAGMGRELYHTQPVFRRVIDRCDEVLRGTLDQPLLSVLYPEEGAYSPIDQTAFTQVALFALECALAELWKSWGVRPDAVMGHSVGEYAAAWAAGVWSLEDGLKLIATRGRMMQALPAGGRMAAVAAGVERVERALGESGVSIAAVNGPADVVISGDETEVDGIVERLRQDGIEAKVLRVSHAFHSKRMDPILDAFEQAVKDLPMAVPRIHLISNVTGKAARTEITTAGYWRRHVRERVEFARGIQTLNDQDHGVFLEIGPSPVLLGMAQKCIDDERTWLPSLRMGRGDWVQMLESVARLYVSGVDLDWEGFDQEYVRKRVMLPTYPFQRERFWLDLEPAGVQQRRTVAERNGAAEVHPLLGRRLRSASRDAQFESLISLEDQPCLADHRVYGHSVLPAAAYLEMALAASAEALGGTHALKDVTIASPLILKDAEPRSIQLVIRPQESGQGTFEIFSFEKDVEEAGAGRWRLHANGSIRPATPATAMSIEAVRARCGEELDVDEFYGRLRSHGMEYGPDFSGAERMWKGDGEVLGSVRLSERPAAEAGLYQIHPALLDAAFQLLAAASVQNNGQAQDEAYLPVGVESVQVDERGLDRLWVHARVRPMTNEDLIVGDVCMFDDGGRVVGEVQGLTGRRAPRAALEQSAKARIGEWMYEVEWSRKDRDTHARHADYLARTEEVASEVSARFPVLIAEYGVEASQGLVAALEKLSVLYVSVALKEMGLVFQLGDRISEESLPERLKVAPAHRRLLRRMMGMLADEGILRLVEESSPADLVSDRPVTWEISSLQGTGEMADAEREWTVLSERYPECEAELTMFGRCARQLASVMQGKSDPLQLLFPNGSMAIAERMYGDSPGALLMNTLVQSAIAKAVERLPEGRKVRVIEVGAGTGGTTAFVLERLPADRSEYVFTDIGPLFTSKARAKFARHQNVRYEILDIEQDPERQGFPAHQFDVVLAANVLHATRDVKQTLRHVKQLLAPGGMLVLVEVTTAVRWVDLIFGLTDGWWRFTDTDLRPDHPLLAEHQWLNVLEETGFADTVTIPDDAHLGNFRGQAVILARNESTSQTASRAGAADWLIFADGRGVGTALAEALRAEGERCVVAYSGEAFQRVADDDYRLASASVEDMNRLVRQAGEVKGVVHLWALDDEGAEPTVDELKRAQERGARSALNLVQALAQADEARPPRLWLVSQRAQAVQPGDGALNVAHAPMWGLGKVISFEHPQLRCVKVDLDTCTTGSDIEAASRMLYEEIRWGDSEDQVALRRGARFVPRLVRSAVADPTRQTAESNAAELRPDATYLITGGLGGLGLLLAGWMVERGARNLALVSRSDPAAEARSEIARLEQAGARVSVFQADVSLEADMERVFSEFARSLPPLRGVVHAAGVLDDGVLTQQTWERFENVMAAKVEGAWNLHRMTQGTPLDFFVLFSSAASIFGSPGQANHAAANAFMDALAHHRSELGMPALSINWGAWGEIGSVVRKNLDKRVGRRGIGHIAPKDGLLCFEQVLSQSRPQVAVVAIDWPVFAAQFPEGKAPPLLSEWSRQRTHAVERTSESSSLVKRLAMLPEDQRAEALSAHVQGLAAKVLGLGPSHPVNPQQPLNEMGMDSLMAVELKNHIQVAIGVTLPASVLFDHPTIEQLSAYLVGDVIVFRPEDGDQLGVKSQAGDAVESSIDLTSIAGLTDGEAEALLSSERQAIGEQAWKAIDGLSPSKRELLLIQLARARGMVPATGQQTAATVGDFDLQAEAVLDPAITPSEPADPGREVSSIFLTGATGYLGSYLLREILEQTPADVYCLVRASDAFEGRRRVISKLQSVVPNANRFESRVHAIVGDLRQPFFGLAPEPYRMWAERIDAIYHCGADVNFVRTYASLKPSTVFGTTEVLRFACQGRTKILHHVSSLAVFGSASKLASSEVIFEDDPLTDSGQPVGYYQSKWVSEKLVMIARERGLPACIYRPGFITGNSQNGDCKLDDLVPLLIRGFVQLEVAPVPEGAAFDLMPVDQVSKSIVHLSRRADSIGKAFNMANPQRILWDGVLDVIESRGYRIRRVSFEDWLAELRKAPPENSLVQMLSFFEKIYETLMTPPAIDARNVREGLADAGIVAVPPDVLFNVYIDYFQKIGFLPVPVRQQVSAD